MYLSPHQAGFLRDVLAAIHARDEDFGYLPAVDRGPPKGLLDASTRAVCSGDALPDLHQLPPNVYYAARACQLLASHPLTAGQVRPWLGRNMRAAMEDLPCGEQGELPLEGCRTHEDVRNRIIVELEELTAEELEAFDAAVREVLDHFSVDGGG